MRYCDIKTSKEMVDYMIDCTLATVEEMLYLKSCPKEGEFRRQCDIAQKGIDWLGHKYRFDSRAGSFASKESAFEYYSRKRIEARNEAPHS